MSNRPPPAPARVPTVLAAVHALLSDERRWVQGDYALAENGSRVIATSPLACRWCLVAAVLRESGRTTEERSALGAHVGAALVEQLEMDYGPGLWLSTWQDAPARTHTQVLALVERARVRLEAGR